MYIVFLCCICCICRVGGVVIFWGCFLLGLLILGRGIFWLVGFCVMLFFYSVMVFWFGDGFNFWGVGFLGLVSVGFCSVFLAFGCCEVLFLYWGVGWFGGLVFIGFLGFCRVLPGCTVSILRVLNFLVFGYIVQLETSTALIFIFLKSLD